MSFPRWSVPATSILAMMLAAGSASAQQPPAAAPAAPADPNAPPPAVAPAAAAAPAAATPAEEEEKARFRWGISGFGGKYFADGEGGGIGGLSLRFGAQVNNMIGVYGQPLVMIGAGVSNSASGGSASAVVLGGVGALVDFTFSDMFFLAAGPELLSGATGRSGVSTGGASAAAESGTFLGLAFRGGVALGSVKPNRRKAFTIGLDFHAVLTDPATLVPLLALGYDSF